MEDNYNEDNKEIDNANNKEDKANDEKNDANHELNYANNEDIDTKNTTKYISMF